MELVVGNREKLHLSKPLGDRVTSELQTGLKHARHRNTLQSRVATPCVVEFIDVWGKKRGNNLYIKKIHL